MHQVWPVIDVFRISKHQWLASHRPLNANLHGNVFAFWSGAPNFNISIHKITDRTMRPTKYSTEYVLVSIKHMIWKERAFHEFIFYEYSAVD